MFAALFVPRRYWQCLDSYNVTALWRHRNRSWPFCFMALWRHRGLTIWKRISKLDFEKLCFVCQKWIYFAHLYEEDILSRHPLPSAKRERWSRQKQNLIKENRYMFLLGRDKHISSWNKINKFITNVMRFNAFPIEICTIQIVRKMLSHRCQLLARDFRAVFAHARCVISCGQVSRVGEWMMWILTNICSKKLTSDAALHSSSNQTMFNISRWQC